MGWLQDVLISFRFFSSQGLCPLPGFAGSLGHHGGADSRPLGDLLVVWGQVDQLHMAGHVGWSRSQNPFGGNLSAGQLCWCKRVHHQCRFNLDPIALLPLPQFLRQLNIPKVIPGCLLILTVG